VIHGRSGQRGGIAAAKTVASGYKGAIKRMAGGFQAWSAMGYDQESGQDMG
jgi:rhodanese-related sulfurtransferase